MLYFTCLSAVAIANNKKEIHRDWEWLEQHMLVTLGKLLVSVIFFVH